MAHRPPGTSALTLATPAGWPDLVVQDFIDRRNVPNSVETARIEEACTVALGDVQSWMRNRDVALLPLSPNEEIYFKRSVWDRARADLVASIGANFKGQGTGDLASEIGQWNQSSLKMARNIGGFCGPVRPIGFVL